MTTLPPTAIKSSSTPLPSIPSISLLPFHISHSGPAQISKYFITRPRPQKRPLGQPPTPTTPSEGPETPVSSEASFRGRLVVSTPLHLPDAYTGLVFSTTVPVPRPSPADIQRGQEEEAERVAKKMKREEQQQSKKAILAASVPLGGRRTSPRKRMPTTQVKQRFSMDSDDEDEDDVAKGEEEATAPPPVVAPEVQAPIEQEPTQAESQPADSLLPPVPASLASQPLLSTLSSSSSLLSTPNTPLPAPQEDDSQPPETDFATPLLRDVRLLVPEVRFNAIQVWNPDMELDTKMDLYWRGVEEWTEVASKIHAY